VFAAQALTSGHPKTSRTAKQLAGIEGSRPGGGAGRENLILSLSYLIEPFRGGTSYQRLEAYQYWSPIADVGSKSLGDSLLVLSDAYYPMQSYRGLV
jgi:hypothetical protein